MLRNMADSLIMHGRIQTTLSRAKELRKVAERLVTLGKRGSLPARRKAVTMLRSHEALHKLFGELATRFKDRQGGYTRIYHLMNHRAGDNAKMAMIEYLGTELILKGKKAKEAEKAQAEKGGKETKAKKSAEASDAGKEKAVKAKEAKQVKAEAAPAKQAKAKAEAPTAKKKAEPKKKETSKKG